MPQPEPRKNPGSHTAITVTNLDGATIAVTVPYSTVWNRRARNLDGKWNPNQQWWEFDARYRDRVLGLIHRVFAWSETDDPADVVTIRIDVSEWDGDRNVIIANRTLATRFDRDSTVRLTPGVALIEGHFQSSGGSINNPRIDTNNAVLEWLDVTRPVAERAKDEHPTAVTIVADGEDRRKALTDRKRLLEQQLAEVTAQLNDLG